MSPRGGACDHPNCCGQPCKQLTDEELEPTPEDTLLAMELINGGWMSVSTKHRRLAKLKPSWPLAEELIRPEMADTKAGGQLAELWHWNRLHMLRRFASGKDSEYVEVKELTLKQFRAFKRMNGASA